MKRHISTVVVFFTSLLGFLCLGLPFMVVGNQSISGYDYLKDSVAQSSGTLESAFTTTKVAVIFLIVLFCVAIVFSVVKFLRDINVIKIKSWAWTEWVNLALVALIAIFAVVAVCGVANYVAEINKFAILAGGLVKLYAGYGVVSTVIIYVLVLAIDIAWVVLRTIKARKEK